MFGLGGIIRGGGGLVTGREMAILCACFFSDIVIP